MDHVQAILSGKELPTVEDFIEWIEEHALNEGVIGQSIEPSSMEEILNSYQPKYVENGDVEDLERCHVTAMEERYAGTVRREAQAKMMKGNQDLSVRTGAELDRKLREAGISSQELGQLSGKKGPLRRKVIKLYNMTNGIREAQGGVDAYLYLGHRFERKFVIYLPINASLAEACWLLKGVCLSQRGQSGVFPNDVEPEWENMVWMYNLLAANKKTVLKKNSAELHTDEDYRVMIRETTRKDLAPPIALITLESFPGKLNAQVRNTRESNQGSEVVDLSKDDGWDLLDKDGNPYFDREIDWATVKMPWIALRR